MTTGREKWSDWVAADVWEGSGRCLGTPDRAPDGVENRKTEIRWQFWEHSTKHRVLTSKKEVTEYTEKEQLTASWKT